MTRLRTILVITILLAIVGGLSFCGNEPDAGKEKTDTSPSFTYLNHADTVTYVGMQTCRKCHEGIYQTFIETGMGQSFDAASRKKSVAKFGKESTIYDDSRDMYYHSYFRDSSMYMTEYRLKGRDTVYKRTEKVDYIVGSGQHTNSHMYSENGYVFQMPMTFYAQQGKWDLPPGFEHGYNTRFSRQIGLECMSCHNSLPEFVEGSENKFEEIPNGIGCERCHGPGSVHVAQKSSGNLVDTSKYIDYSIVNPGKLTPDLQFDVCQRCHLQGNAVLKPGKSFLDFRPGMRLSDFMTVFMPKYEGAEDEFIMASHAERLKMSPCFIQTEKKKVPDTVSLRPSKSSMTCVTCHNPHVSVKVTGNAVFNSACTNCHNPATTKSELKQCSDTPEHLNAAGNNCVTCHMPRSGSIDIPHVTVHDHYIRKPSEKKPEVIDSLRKFLGLFAVNEKNPSPDIIAKAYLQQYERFNHDPQFLDSAARYLPRNTPEGLRSNFSSLVHLYFLRNDYMALKNTVEQTGRKFALDSILVNHSFDNADAWTAYRIGETYFHLQDLATAELFYKKAVDLAPYHPEFRSKYALALATQQKNFEARSEYQTVVGQYPKYVPALTNLGYLWLKEGDDVKAEQNYNLALDADPDYEQALMNMAGLWMYRNQPLKAKPFIDRALVVNPGNAQAKVVLESIMATGKH
jgi:tetratricopeptide (TPR) repeat protein